MNSFSRNTAVTSLLACCIATSLIPTLAAQELSLQSNLPTYRVGEVGDHLASARIAAGLNAALNSPGDSFQFEVEATISAALIAFFNVGASQRLEVEVKRTDVGYEASIGHTSAMTMGIEAYQGLEVNAGPGFGKTVLFSFDSASNAATAIEAMALAKALGVDRNLPTAASLLHSMIALVGQAETALANAFNQLQAATALEAVRSVALTAARSTFSTANSALNTARGVYDSALAEVRRIEALIRDSGLPSWALRPLYDLLALAATAFGDARDALESAQRAYDSAVSAFHAADRDFRAAVAAVAEWQAEHLTWTARLAGYVRDRDAAQSTWLLFSTPRDIIARHLAGVEFKVQTGAALSAVLTAPGLNLLNAGVGFEQSAKFGAKVRVLFVRSTNPQRKVIVTGFAELDSRARAGAVGIGMASRIGSQLEVKVTFVQVGVRPVIQQFRVTMVPVFAPLFIDTTAKIDMSVLALAGVGVAAAHGVGRELEVSIDTASWRHIVNTMPQMLQSPSLDTLLTGLRGVRVGVASQDRWIAGGVMQIGIGVLGYGVNFAGHALWNDTGVRSTTTLDAAKFESLFLEAGQLARQFGDMATVVAQLP